jgi:hypothetical protein
MPDRTAHEVIADRLADAERRRLGIRLARARRLRRNARTITTTY